MSAKNIVTGVVVALAVVLVAVVALIKTGVISTGSRSASTKTSFDENDTVIESTIVLASETDANGDMFYYTMVDYYARPRISSNHTYPTTKPKTTEPQETEAEDFVELTSVVQLSDENGNPLFDENGEPLTQIVSYTVPASDVTTTEVTTTAYVQRTAVVQVTNRLRRPVYDANGNPVTEVIYLDPPASAAPSASTEPGSEGEPQSDTEPATEAVTTTSTTRKIGVDLTPDVSREDAMAQEIVNQINESRSAAELPPLTHDTSLKASARSGSLNAALPQVYGSRGIPSDAYRYSTKFGGSSLGNQILSNAGSRALSADTTKVGIGIVKKDDVYYTTVIFA